MKRITKPLDLIHLLCCPIKSVPEWESAKNPQDPKATPIRVYQLLKYMAAKPFFDFTFMRDHNRVLITPKFKPADSLLVIIDLA